MSRPLHWCLKIGDRLASNDFYHHKLEMIILRHEEFAEGCAATCNGPYSNRWSKTMIGYGPEESNFILELTHNFGIDKYAVGNDYNGIVIESTKLFEKLSSEGILVNESLLKLTDPDGYPVQIVKGDSNKVIRCEINVENLENSLKYWCDILGLSKHNTENNYADIAYQQNHPKLRLIEIKTKIDHKTGWGRYAFATPTQNLLSINDKIKASGNKFLHEKVELGTPGKQSVTVIILLDPDNYEICFVNDEDYSLLSQPDPEAKNSLERELKKEMKKKSNV